MTAHLLAVLMLACSAAVAAPWNSTPKPIKGSYQMYGGHLDEMTQPTSKDRKVSLMFSGPFARELFDSIGPDLKVACSDALDYRERHRADLSCTRYRGEYTCYIGLNVVTGKSMEGSIC
jgi:hypothetical protein